MDRGKCGTALHLACDARAMPLGVVVTGAKANDGCQTEDVLQALLVLSRLGKAGDPRAGDALKLLIRRRRADGRWQPGGCWWRPSCA